MPMFQPRPMPPMGGQMRRPMAPPELGVPPMDPGAMPPGGPPGAPMGPIGPGQPVPPPNRPPMGQPGPLMPMQDAGQMQRQFLIEMLKGQSPNPDGGMPAQMTMPKPFMPPTTGTGRSRGGY